MRYVNSKRSFQSRMRIAKGRDEESPGIPRLTSRPMTYGVLYACATWTFFTIEISLWGAFEYGPSIKKSLYYDLDDLSKLMNTIDRQNHLSILNINARSLVKHYLEFCSILQRLPFLFQIITVEETWLNDTLKPLIQMENYTIIPKHKLKWTV